MTDERFAREALSRCVLFSRLDAPSLDACARRLRLRHYRHDETVFHQGDPGDALHVIASGVALVDADPGLRRALLAALAAELRRLTGHVESLHFLGLPGRLARRIGDLAAAADPDGAGGARRVDWPYTQAALAGMVGGWRESVNRLLADLVGRGLIRFERDALIVQDADRLTAEAQR